MYTSEDEITELVRAFEDCRLAREHWTHTAHLTVALWYLIRSPRTAVEKIRFGIQRYNHTHGIESTPTGGYHETITLFWIHLIQTDLNHVDIHDSLLNLANQLIHHYADPAVLFEYYSRDCLFSPLARSTWVEPNLKSF
ncbi:MULTISPECIES: hypothetical protein [Leptolyngbya]|uniref:hypothetical protein n=1 Tax=Leptolyngbya TaxID=47251 RepID=UPI001687AEC9|nr:hypothetical protein [Leptolyngbya sp. FACHB-1624]MBD1859091.1 hypothetical protein [Leptolyngbya sp. FACHB-1624]